MIVVVDYGMGNLRSIVAKLQQIDISAAASSDPAQISDATGLILPGVGHFAAGMDNLRRAGLIPILNRKVLEERTPVLGICLGMQLFGESSEEGDVPGLGWISARSTRFSFSERSGRLPVPHVGWNTLNLCREPWGDIAPDQRFYFTHSYHLCCDRQSDVLATTRYGCDFVSMIHHANIYGAQFHPEKSHRRGFELIRAFACNN